MDEVSPDVAANARKAAQRVERIESLILRRLADVRQRNVAKALKTSETRVSRWQSEGHFREFAQLLDELGLKVVPVTHECYDPQEVDSLQFFARRYLEQPQSAARRLEA